MTVTAPVRTPEAPPAEQELGGLSLARLKQLTSIVAPTTMITALLFYFGYIGTRSRFEYFGVYLDMTDLSHQQLLLYGLEVIYVPAALILLAVLAATTLHALVVWLLDVRGSDTAILFIGPGAVLLGILLIGRALLGVFNGNLFEDETPGTTGLTLALGPAIAAYGIWLSARHARRTADGGDRARLIAWFDSHAMAGLRRSGQICVAALIVAGLFWAAHSFAWAFGAGRAYQYAVKLPGQPEVVLDTTERLSDVPPMVKEDPLAATKDTTFRYRYRNLRLLLASGDRLFLVPRNWTKQGRTLVVPYNSNVRIQLIPQPG